MKMKATRKTHWLLAGAMALLVAGFAGVSCTKGGSLNLNFRKGVRFSASMSTSGTRTSYSGEGTTDAQGLLARERIDWTDGDLIRVYSPQAAQPDGSTHYADYEIQSHETVGTPGAQLTSRATVAVKEGTEQLYWEESPGRDMVHDFFAVYPSPTTQGFTPGHTLEQDGVLFASETVGEDEVMTFTGVTPATQTVSRKNATENVWLPDMRPAYMLATASSTQAAADENGVTLQFIPKFSAFEFTVASGDNPTVKLTSFSLTATEGYLTGAFKISQADFGITTEGIADANVTDGGKTITVNFGADGITVTNVNPLTFAVLALPQRTSGLIISFTGDVIGTRTLELKMTDGTPISWAPYKKHRIYGLSFPALTDAIIVDPIIWNGVFVTDAIIGDAIAWNSEYESDVAASYGDNVNWDSTDTGNANTSGDSINWNPQGEGSGTIGDNINWGTDHGIVGPFGGLYLTKGYLTKTDGGYALTGDDQLEILQYYNAESVSATPRHYLLPGDLPSTAAFPGYAVPTQAQWETVLGTGASPRTGAIVNDSAGKHYSKVTVDLTGTDYEAYGFGQAVKGVLLLPDGKSIDCWDLTVFDTPGDEFTSSITYVELASLLAKGCAFLPCAGEYSGGWQNGGTAGFYWSGDAAGVQLGFDAAGFNYASSTACAPVRMIKTWN